MAERDAPRQLHDVGGISFEYLGADFRVGLHNLPLVAFEAPGLQQYAVGNADLADVVHGTGLQDQRGVILIQSRRKGQPLAPLAHAHDMHAGLVVSVLAGASQAADDLETGLLQFGRALAHLRLEGFGLPTLLFVEEPHFQHVADPVQELFVLQRLGDKILGSLLEGPETDLGGGIGGQHEDRQVIPRSLRAIDP